MDIFSPNPSPSEMPRKGTEFHPGRLKQVDRTKGLRGTIWGNKLLCPADIRDLFRSYEKLQVPDQRSYFGAAALYQIALTAGRRLATVRLSYKVAAVDALTGQHNQRAFIDLVEHHYPNASAKFLKHLYGNVRSAHFHFGLFPGGEYNPMDIGPVAGPSATEGIDLELSAHQTFRGVLIKWLLDRA